MDAQGTKTTQCLKCDDPTPQWSSAFTMLSQTGDFPHSEDSSLQDLNAAALPIMDAHWPKTKTYHSDNGEAAKRAHKIVKRPSPIMVETHEKATLPL